MRNVKDSIQIFEEKGEEFWGLQRGIKTYPLIHGTIYL